MSEYIKPKRREIPDYDSVTEKDAPEYAEFYGKKLKRIKKQQSIRKGQFWYSPSSDSVGPAFFNYTFSGWVYEPEENQQMELDI